MGRKLTRKDKIAQSGSAGAPDSSYAAKLRLRGSIIPAAHGISIPSDVDPQEAQSDVTPAMLTSMSRENLVRRIELIARTRTPVFVYYEGLRSNGSKLVFRIDTRDQLDARFTLIHTEGGLSQRFEIGFFFDLDDVHKFNRGGKFSNQDRANFIEKLVGRTGSRQERATA